MTVQICFQLGDELAPLLCQYDTQSRPQPAYVEMTDEGCVNAGYNSEIGNAVPRDVWSGATLRWSVNPEVSGDALAKCLNDPDTLALLERVHQGHDVSYVDGSFRGRLNDDAQAAFDELQKLFEGLDTAQVWDTDEWLFSGCDLVDHWSEGQSLQACADALEYHAHQEGVVLLGQGIFETLEQEAQRCVTECRGPLLPDSHLQELLALEIVTQEEVDDYLAFFERKLGE